MAENRERLLEMQRTHHEQAYSQRIGDGTCELWLGDWNASRWCNELMYRDLRPFFQALPRQRVLTVGDGKGGQEARFVRELGHHAVASDLCTEVLVEAKRRGLIDEFAEANAERLPYDDQSFDYVVTKETLHHLQRPYQAVYEMLRVAKQCAVVIEPHFRFPQAMAPQPPQRRRLKRLWRRLRGKPVPSMSASQSPTPLPNVFYEPSGNYVFQFHPHELMQTALAMGLRHVAFHYAHHYWEDHLAELQGSELQAVIDAKEKELRQQDEQQGFEARPVLIFLIFKQPPPPEAADALRRSGFTLPDLQSNPLLNEPLDARRAA